MTLEEYRQKVLSADLEHWTRIGCSGGSGPSYKDMFSVWQDSGGEFVAIDVESHTDVFSLKTDLDISVACGLKHLDDFQEAWANSFPDPSAMSGFVDFFYGAQLIYRDIYVAVDGGRARLPLPSRDSSGLLDELRYFFPREKVQFFKLLNLYAPDYEDYIMRTDIPIVDSVWLS